MNLVAIDFEFNNTSERDVNLVSCSLQVKGCAPEEYWLHNDQKAKSKLANRLMQLREDHVFLAYAVEAEARSFLALGLNPLNFKWVDLYLEYRHLLNHNNKLAYGKQLIQGRVRNTRPPKNKWNMTEEDKKKADMSKPEYGMAAACFNLLGVKVDTAFKDSTRDLIISAPKEFSEEERKQIITYCTSDIIYLFQLWGKMKVEYKSLYGGKLDTKRIMRQIYLRSRYSCRTAFMVREGYPINYEKTKNFSNAVSDILYTLQRDINEQFPDTLPFEKDRKLNFVWKQKKTKAWVADYCKENKIDNWKKTDKGDFSLSLDAFEQFFPYRHNYPRGNFGAQMVRYLKTKRNLNGFLPNKTGKKKKTFWDSVGSDNRVRPYFGIYGSQSSRSQPAATGFLFLKSAWMRALCEPPKGRAITSIDFGSQEFLLSALLSKDKNMLDAYQSGDPYLYFAKLAGAVPWDGTKDEFKKERNLFKSTTLGLSYGMGAKMLALKLTADTGEEVDELTAQDLIDKFRVAYPDYDLFRVDIQEYYKLEGYITLADGWSMWGDNSNAKSVGNVPIQGMGACIMRKSVELAQDKGLDVIFTLHDALYIEHDLHDDEAIITLANCMDEATRYYFKDETKAKASVRLDADTWSPEYEKGSKELEYCNGKIEVNVKDIYIDERAEKEYKIFSKYFDYSLDDVDF